MRYVLLLLLLGSGIAVAGDQAMTFEEARKEMAHGASVLRLGWEEGISIRYVFPDQPHPVFATPKDGIPYGAYIVMEPSQGESARWLGRMIDLLSRDWVLDNQKH